MYNFLFLVLIWFWKSKKTIEIIVVMCVRFENFPIYLNLKCIFLIWLPVPKWTWNQLPFQLGAPYHGKVYAEMLFFFRNNQFTNKCKDYSLQFYTVQKKNLQSF